MRPPDKFRILKLEDVFGRAYAAMCAKLAPLSSTNASASAMAATAPGLGMDYADTTLIAGQYCTSPDASTPSFRKRDLADNSAALTNVRYWGKVDIALMERDVVFDSKQKCIGKLILD